MSLDPTHGRDEDVTVCVLLFGDFPDLAKRCLDSIVRHVGSSQIRVWGNAISSRTAKVLDGYVWRGSLEWQNVVRSAANRLKYPVMREYLYSPEYRITSKHLMWFDDDSFITSKDPKWFSETMGRARRVAVMGSPFTCALAPKQRDFVRDQPWYTGKEIPPRTRFAVGGWWVADVATLRRFNWPIPELRHRGGDVMLGELMSQNDLKLGHCSIGVAVNADEKGRDARSPRRGYDEPSLGLDYVRRGG